MGIRQAVWVRRGRTCTPTDLDLFSRGSENPGRRAGKESDEASCRLDREGSAPEDCRGDFFSFRSGLRRMLLFAKQCVSVLILVGVTLQGVVPAAGPCAHGTEQAADAPQRCCAAPAPAKSCCGSPAHVQACGCSAPGERPANSRDERPSDLRISLRCAALETPAWLAPAAGGISASLPHVASSLSSTLPRLQALLCCWQI